MKKRNYVVAISLIALLGQTGGLSAMGWARQKAGKAKVATVDSLYKKSKDFVKEVKTLKRCHKAGDCTSAQYRKIKRMGAAVAVTAAAVAVGVGIGASFGAGAVVQERQELKDQAARRFNIHYKENVALLSLVADNNLEEIKIELKNREFAYGDKAIHAALWIVRKRSLSELDTKALELELEKWRKKKK